MEELPPLDSRFDAGAAQAMINDHWDTSILPALCDFIRIPSQSPLFDPEWESNGLLDKSIAVLKSWVEAQSIKGLSVEVVSKEGFTPVILIEVDATAKGKAAGTVLMYGHADTQPPFVGWNDGLEPYNPVVKDGKLYGRGSCDDGYAVFCAVSSIMALKTQNLDHGRIVVLIEASEESGSIHLPQHLGTLKERIGTPNLIVCLDSGCGNYEQLWVTTSLRGVVVGELTASGIKEGVHSGDASGIVPSSFRVMRQLLDRLEDSTTGKVLPKGLWCQVPEPRKKQVELAAQVLGDTVWSQFPFRDGAIPVEAESEVELALNRTWRPQLSVTGAAGFPTLAQAGNVLRPFTTLTLSMRIPPNVVPDRAATIIKEVLEADPPLGMKVEYNCKKAGTGWEAPAVAKWLEMAAETASQQAYEKPCCYLGEGGSIPFMV